MNIHIWSEHKEREPRCEYTLCILQNYLYL